MRQIISASTVIAAALLFNAAPADAATLLVSATNGGSTIEFTIDDTPAPDTSTGDYVGFYQSATLNGTNQSGVLQFWTNPGSYNGGFTFSSYDSVDFFYTGSGPVLFSGPTSGPTILAGAYTFSLGRASISPAGAVPEPGTWGIMLLGFAGIGIALRKNRRRTFSLTKASLR